MAKFAYNNLKNASMGHTPFEHDCRYYPRVFFEDEYNTYSRSFSADRLAMELRKLITIYRQNLLYTQDIQKQTYDKGVKLCSYTPSKKV